MVLLFFRHGEAEEVGPGGSDSQRRLVAEGREENRVCLEALQRAGVRPEVIVHSPLVRAAETAAMANEALRPEGGVHPDARLACGAGLSEVREVIEDHCPAETAMLVGHNPDFSEVAGQLIGDARVVLKTSGLACITLPRVEAGVGRLEWLIKPKLFPRK